MNWINLRTEYSFKSVYGPVPAIIELIKSHSGTVAGIADLGNTFGHVSWEKECKRQGIRPIYGTRVFVSLDLQRSERRFSRWEVSLIAKNPHGLQEIYELTDLSYQQFYYIPRITLKQFKKISDNVIKLVPVAKFLHNTTCYMDLNPATPAAVRNGIRRPIACPDNYYMRPDDELIYEPLADERKIERKTSPIWIPTTREWKNICQSKKALKTLKAVTEQIEIFDLPKAKMISFPDRETSLKKMCRKGAALKGIDLSDPVYKKRLKRELKLIKEKGYTDYFFVVADLIQESKKKMVVGPARGSSAGSLVCYLINITDVDPIKYGLYFERFIDVNRHDLPDIDIDFQDNKRHLAISYLSRKYGHENVSQIGNISRWKPKSILVKFSKVLGYPTYDLKDSIIERSPGDQRAHFCMTDTLNNTKVGKEYIKQFPAMQIMGKAENHVSHSSVHAAGVIVSNKPITNFCGINSRDPKTRISMIDKRDAEYLNLLKIDVLGLRTLSVLAETCEQLGKPFSWLYNLKTGNKKAFKIFSDHRLNGIFQFDGATISKLTARCPIESISDIAAMVSIARPGPLVSGGANSYIKARRGDRPAKYLSDNPAIVEATKETYGVLVYQEQVLEILRNYGHLSWSDTSILRKALSKSKGEEFFKPFFKKFKKGHPKKEAVEIWDHIKTFGEYGFNKSHAVSYAIISYWTAYLKANFPLQFTVASLNNSRDDQTSLRLLRDMYEHEKIKYVPFDKKKSEINWSVKYGILYGGALTLDGIGPAHARKFVNCRNLGTRIPDGIKKHIKRLDTPFISLYPGREIYGAYYEQWRKFTVAPIVEISTIKKDGLYFFIGQLRKKSLRDLNEPDKVIKRNGMVIDDGENTAYLSFALEDDTGEMQCTINRFLYLEYGTPIMETGKENKSWYLVHGQYKKDHERIYVKEISEITK